MTTRAEVQRDLGDRLGSATEARWMVDEVLGRHVPAAAPVSEAARTVLDAMAGRRRNGEPLQYVLGTWAFRTVELSVDARALIPRPETEQVVEVALRELRRRRDRLAGGTTAAGTRPGPVVVDLGTGSGAVALALAVELVADEPLVEVWATDVDPDALALAGANRARVGAGHASAAERVRLRQGSWYDALPRHLVGRIDLVVANPPYVSEEEWDHLGAEVRLEPRRALVAPAGSDGTQGFAGVEAVLTGAVEWLAPGGAVVVELAPHQATAAAVTAERLGFSGTRVERDLAGRDRAVVAHR